MKNAVLKIVIIAGCLIHGFGKDTGMRKRNVIVGIILGACVSYLLSASSTDTPLGKEFNTHHVISDISYKSNAPDCEQNLCRLDLYLPKGAKGFPVLVWLHGGSLKFGDKSEDDATVIGKRFPSEGVGVALVNYRLNPHVTFPTYIEDAAASVAWVLRNIGQYNGNPEDVFVGGWSAGAYLAAMIALDDKYLNKHGLSPKAIAGIIPMSGQMYSHSTVREERGIPSRQVVIDDTAPLYHAEKIALPCLLFCAEGDDPSVLEQNTSLFQALQSAGQSDSHFIIAPDRDHFGIVGKVFDGDDIVVKNILNFIDEHS